MTKLRIRNEQLEAFEQSDGTAFEAHMVEHLKEFTPLHSNRLGEENIRKMIRLGVERGKNHGFTRSGAVKFYIELFFLLGVDFDTDPQYHVLRSILTDDSISDQIVRGDLMYEEVMRYLDAVGGPGRHLTIRTLRKARQLPYKGIPISASDYDDQMLQQLNDMRPEKYNYVGVDALRELIAIARQEADRYSVLSDEGLALFIGLMYALGHGVIKDHKYTFIEHTLKNEAVKLEARPKRVYSKVMTYLDHVLEHIDGK